MKGNLSVVLVPYLLTRTYQIHKLRCHVLSQLYSNLENDITTIFVRVGDAL
jgi:hypothetical protein